MHEPVLHVRWLGCFWLEFFLRIQMMLCYLFGLELMVDCGPFIQLSFALVFLAVNWYTVPQFLHLLLKSLRFFMICAMVKTAPFFYGFSALFDMNNFHQFCSSFLVWSGGMHCCVLLTCYSPRRSLFLHTLSFECPSKLCITFLNQVLVYFHFLKCITQFSHWIVSCTVLFQKYCTVIY